ncbi:hypothetical protein O181_048221 [Austropuccinia psidii MF-1]|uniref:Uncharacterized protein n=1 Tax=Austropuccinia psidii MF-1 TaxID=1389203 RepID=A0A9Q3DXK9_9BASI|nr:hypothetical protein [Austropuccinia psidii MF-1]
MEVGTWPDIAYSVNLLARHAALPLAMPATPTGVHGPHDKHIPGSTTTGPQALPEGVFRCNLGGKFSRSTHGNMVQLNGCTKSLVTMAASSCHAEFMVLGLVTRHGKWAANLLEDMIGTSDPFHLL